MLETLLGGVFGGVLRLAPEVMKIFSKGSDHKHELAMLNAEMEFSKVRGEIAMRQTEAAMTIAELDAIGGAFKEQASTAKAAGKFIAGISALVRPMVTYLFVGLYALVKIAAFTIALQQGGNWQNVLITLWSVDDMAVMNMILSFWFVGRSIDRDNRRIAQ